VIISSSGKHGVCNTSGMTKAASMEKVEAAYGSMKEVN
jgi:hypothetical protein